MPLRELSIDSALKSKCRATALACVSAHVKANPSPRELREEMKARERQILQLPDPRGVLESAQISAARAAYKALGKDPARYRGSAEALLRRVIAGKFLPEVNAVVDVINLVSIESRLPVGLYDMANVTGDIAFRAGRAGETYKGIGKYDLNLEGLPVFCDEIGPHGSPTSDSERTMVTNATTQVLAVIISFGGFSSEGSNSAEHWLGRLIALLERYANARDCETTIVL
jgi:DNA/RNA-binding domain of Phe-tRNA-synthetase-like protein